MQIHDRYNFQNLSYLLVYFFFSLRCVKYEPIGFITRRDTTTIITSDSIIQAIIFTDSGVDDDDEKPSLNALLFINILIMNIMNTTIINMAKFLNVNNLLPIL